MLQTLLKIGKWQSEGKSEWDRFLDFPKVVTKDKHGNPIKNYTLPIIFDLDANEVVISQNNLEEYDVFKIRKLIPIKVKGGNNKAIYTSVPASKLNQIYKTFFGKEGDEKADRGELVEAIEKVDTQLLSESFLQLMRSVFDLKQKFIEKTQNLEKKEIDFKVVRDAFNLDKTENISFITIRIIGEEFDIKELISFSEIPEYRSFLEKTFFKEKKNNYKQDSLKLCYASGDIDDDVAELGLETRYSLNKMFVTETRNYASVFDKNKFSLNYQVSIKNQEYLDYASDYLLNQGYKTRIANIDHVIIPQFLTSSEVNLKMALEGIHRKLDLLFNLNSLDAFSKNVQDWLDKEDDVFWINFVAFESDGNFFKSTEIIKDISSFHFNNLIECFYEINKAFREADFVKWESVMMDFGEPRDLNFNSLYQLIPLRKDKEKKNKALSLFKTILENRKVDSGLLYDYFSELILCHYYQRYNSYTNVKKYGKDFFYFSVRDSVFKYLAFFQLLKKLKLIDMEDQITTEMNASQYGQLENEFFQKMNFSQQQRAMFYLGRMLNSVEYLQQGKNKTVIQKVNFNGMDKDSIQRLRIDLIEKAKQYNSMNKVIFTDQKFGKEFDFNNWHLNPQEAMFFMLTGYSFGAGKKGEDNNNNINE